MGGIKMFLQKVSCFELHYQNRDRCGISTGNRLCSLQYNFRS